jgi:hypothetical protein
VDLRGVRRRCEARLRAVEIPDPFELRAFADVISRRRGRSLTLLAKQTSLGPCGVWLALPDADYVFYEPRTSALHQQHIILHELGHLLHEHEPSERLDDDVLQQLFPTLDAHVVRRVLGRSSYTAVEEQEAEMVASLLSERTQRRVLTSRTVGPSDGVTDRLWSTLGARNPPTRHG